MRVRHDDLSVLYGVREWQGTHQPTSPGAATIVLSVITPLMTSISPSSVATTCASPPAVPMYLPRRLYV